MSSYTLYHSRLLLSDTGGTGTAGSTYGNYGYSAVPFGSTDFNVPNGKCNTGSGNIENYQDVNQVRNCNLVGLPDLDTSKSYVRGKLIDYMNTLIGIGIAGFRVDACKHMWPGELDQMFGSLTNLNTQWFYAGSRPFIFQEVIDQGGEPITAGEYTPYGRVTEFKYGINLGQAFKGGNSLSWYSNFGEEWGFLADGSSLVFVDNHDNQRGHGGGGSIVTHKTPREYKMANAYMLAWPYGFVRLMSSYYFSGGDESPPADGNGNTKSPTFGSDGSCEASSGWVCEHRWRPIRNMVGFRNAAINQGVNNWWDNGGNQIAFSRGNKAFIIINNDGYGLTQSLQTGVPGGEYCDIIHGDFDSYTGTCSGPTIQVDFNGYASFSINNGEDAMIAIHVNARVGEGGGDPGPTNMPPGTQEPPPSGYARTVIFIKQATQSGEDMFTLGGIDHTQRSGCNLDADSSNCAIHMQHLIGGSNDKFNAWKEGDDFLDWYGAENDQGSYQGTPASGTPLVWTTNDSNYPYHVDTDGFGYTPLNKWGEHYWMLDVNLNCDRSEDGWFEVKAYVMNGSGWESDRNQDSSCGGTVGGSKPYTTGNHFGRCGYINVFEFNQNSCMIDSF